MADLLVRVDATTAQFDAAMAKASKATLRYEATLKTAQKAQLEFDAAVAASGASSNEAALAQAKLTRALERTAVAENQAGIAAKRTAEIQAASSAKAAAAAEAAAAKQAATTRKLGSIAGGFGLAAAASLGLAAKAASDYNAKMAQVQSLTKASAEEMAKLSGATSGFADIGVSATEAADAEIELVKAGLSVADITGGALAGALNLAAAGQLNVADATEIAAQAMTQFELAGEDVPHIADLLAAGADRALGSVQDLGEGLSYSGLTAHQLGLSVEETVGSLAAFAQAGLLGSQGGAAFQQMLLKLENPTAKAAGLMEAYGLAIYDAQGNFVGMEALAGQLQSQFAGLSKETRLAAFSTLFGSRAVRAANVLYAEGADGIADWEEKVNESGFAAEQAAGKMDSLQGDMQKLSAEVQNAAINFGQQFQPALRAITQELTSFVGFLDHIPGPLKEAAALTLAFTAAVGLGTFAYTRATAALSSMATTLGLVATKTTAAGAAQSTLNAKMLAMRAGAGLAGIGLLTLSSNISDTHETLGGLTKIAGAAALGFSVGGPFGAAVGGAIGLLTTLETAGFNASEAMNALNASLEQQGTLSGASKGAAGLVSNQQLQLLSAAGLSTRTYTQALLGNATAQGTVIEAAKKFGFVGDMFLVQPLEDANAAADAYADHLFLLQQQVHKVTPEQAELGNATRAMGGAMADTAGDLLTHSKAAKDAAASTDELTNAATRLSDALLGDQAALESSAALLAYKAALDAVNQGLKDNGKTLNKNTEAGRANVGILNNIASAALQYGNTLDAGSKRQTAYFESARQSLYDQAKAFGYTDEQARNYVNTVLDIPDEVKTKADIDTQAAMAQIKALQTQYDLTPAEVKTIVEAAGATTAAAQVKALRDYLNQLQSKTVQVHVDTYLRTIGSSGGHSVYTPAEGGYIRGPGTETSDSIPAMLSDKEFVVKAAAVRKYGVAKMMQINAMQAPVGFAAGGMAHASTPASGGWGSQQVIVQAPSGPFRIVMDVGGQTVTGVMEQVAKATVRGSKFNDRMNGWAT